MNPSYNLHRVKVYKLNATGGWDDKGTGLVSVEFMEQAESLGLVVVSEEDTRTLLIHRISKEEIYHRQDDTIITWQDQEIGTDVALSFQEATGCNAIWQQILQVQKDDFKQGPDGLQRRRVVADEFEQVSAAREGNNRGPFPDSEAPQGMVELPPAEMGNLEELAKVLSHVSIFQRERIATQLTQPNYIKSLVTIFRQCEDLEQLGSLHELFKIFRGAIMVNDTQVLEELLKDDHAMDIIGALEYDPELPVQQRHRKFLQENVVFKEVVPITNPQVVAKIHQTYRIQYLKDVILPRALDDATYATLSSLALFNNVEVITTLATDAQFLPKLFERLQQRGPEDPEWHDLVAFLQELCSLAKHLQPPHRQSLFQKLVALGMFEVITKVVQHSQPDVKLAAYDILLSVMQHDAAPLRTFLQNQADHELFQCLMEELVGGSNGGLPEQVAELLKSLMDPETMEQHVEHHEFLDLFYNKFAKYWVDCLTAADQKKVPASALGLVVDLLCFCVQHHGFRIKHYFLKSINLIEKVIRLVRRRERWLVVAAIRFVRTCIGMKDDFYTRYLTRNGVFDPIWTVFFENGDRYNLLNSTVLEMVEYIRKENVKGLISFLIEHYSARFEDHDYVETFRQLKVKYEQCQEATEGGQDGVNNTSAAGAGPNRVGPVGNRRRRRDERDLDRDEEDYFSEADGEDEGPQAGSSQPEPPRPPGASPPRGPSPGASPKEKPLAVSSGQTPNSSQHMPATSASSNHQGPHRDNPPTSRGANVKEGSGAEEKSWLSGLAQYGDDEDDHQEAGKKPSSAPVANASHNAKLPSSGPDGPHKEETGSPCKKVRVHSPGEAGRGSSPGLADGASGVPSSTSNAWRTTARG